MLVFSQIVSPVREFLNNCAISDDFSEGDFDSFFDVILDLEIDE